MHNAQQNQVALVTGSARRIGAEVVRKLHSEGMRIILHYHSSRQPADELANQLNAQRENSVVTIPFDLHKIEQFDEFAEKIINVWGRLDVLINNASTFYPTELDSLSEIQWDELININLKAPLFLSKSFKQYLQKQHGCIINIVDIHADRPLKGYTVYCIAKAGLAMLTKSLARELAPNVRVNGISPGAILWPEVEEYEQVHQEIIERTALKKEGHPSDIANTAWFLIHAADYITGQIIAVDGGRTLSN